MTELEGHLLKSLQRLEQQCGEQLSAAADAQNALARDLREYLERQRDIARERAALDRAGAALEHHARAVEQWVARRPRARERHADREPGD